MRHTEPEARAEDGEQGEEGEAEHGHGGAAPGARRQRAGSGRKRDCWDRAWSPWALDAARRFLKERGRRQDGETRDRRFPPISSQARK